MPSSKEFLRIIEENLLLQEDGSVSLDIKDSTSAEEYASFIAKHARKEEIVIEGVNIICVNIIYCKQD